GTEISFSCSDSFNVSKNSEASLIVKDASSKIFLRVLPALMKTLRASTRSRAPWHRSQGSSPPKYFVPRPLQAGHAPYGELKENKRGSTSGKEKPSFLQANFADITNSSEVEACFLSWSGP